MVTKKMISEWFDEGVANGTTHMIIVCDTFAWEDYPVFVSKDEDVNVVEAKYTGKNMQRVMEVYNLHADKEQQLTSVRAFNR